MEAYAGKHACDSNQLKLISGFDDDSGWSDDSDASAVSAAGPKEQDQLRQCTSKSTDMEVVVSPLVRSIFKNPKKPILDARQKPALRKDHLAPIQIKHGPLSRALPEDYEKMLQEKVQALDKEVAIFKKESKRLKKLSKENADGLTKLAREKAEWEEHKKSHMLAFQAQQEEQMEKLKKERQMLDHRNAAMNSLPASQRKEVEELKETLAKQQEENRGKELRLRLAINRLRAKNEDLTRQVLEMQDELRRYETCLLSALDDRESIAPAFSKRLSRESNHRQAPLDGRGRSVLKATMENSYSMTASATLESPQPLSSRRTHSRSESVSTPRLLSEQAKTLSNLFSRPWTATGSAAKENCASVMSRHLMTPKLAD